MKNTTLEKQRVTSLNEVIEEQTGTIELDKETDAFITENAAKLGISPEQYISEHILNQFIQQRKQD